MTTIAAIHVPGEGTWYASDQQLNIGGTVFGPRPKWARLGHWACGAAGDARTLDLLETHVEYLLKDLAGPRDFVQRLEKTLVNANYSSATDGPFGAPAWGQDFMLAGPNAVWALDMTLSIMPIPSGKLWAAGSGEQYAIGAARALRELVEFRDMEHQMEMVIAFASEFDSASGQGAYIGHIPAVDVEIVKKTPRRRIAPVA